MAARPTMQHLIARLRLWISDPSGAGATLTDAELQAYLDDNRVDVAREELCGAQAMTPTGATWTTYRAAHGWWEDTAVLQDAGHETLTPTGADLLRGVWTFTDQAPPVYLTGARYDAHAAAADALTHLIAGMRSGAITDWSDGQVTVRRSDAIASLRALAADHRRRSESGGARQIRLRRRDQVPAA